MIQTFLDITFLFLLILTVILSLLSIEHPNIMYALFFFFVMNVALGILYYMLGAPLVALVQLAIFSGAIVVLFLLTAMVTKGGEWR
ncbi:MAG: NADH-quinone oxidoreductase subunit J [Candidatus Bathyarchaeia archaeon]